MPKRLLSTQPPFSQIAQEFPSGKTTPRDYLEECIKAIEAREPTIMAFTTYDLESARRCADASAKRYREGKPLSPIDGMPIGIKDIIDTRDMQTGMNNDIYHDHKPMVDAACVAAIKQGGAVPIGKTVTTEFAIGRSGPTVNPHNPEHTPGGSSSGSAAGVAAGFFPAGFGTQTQGSIIRPASFCGAVGYKPSHGSLSMNGVHPLSRSHDHLGVLADSLDDAWWLARWVSEVAPDEHKKGISGPLHGKLQACQPMTVAVLRTNGFDDLEAEGLAAFESQLEEMRTAGIKVVEPNQDPLLSALCEELHDLPERSLELLSYEMRWPFQGYVEAYPEKVGERIHGLMNKAAGISREQYRSLLLKQQMLRQRMAMLAGTYDALVLPAASGPAPHGFEYTGARTLLIYSTFMGCPAFSLPLMRVHEMPFGLQLIGFDGSDHALARHAQWFMSK